MSAFPPIPDQTYESMEIIVCADGMPTYDEDVLRIVKETFQQPREVRVPGGCSVQGEIFFPDGRPADGVIAAVLHDPCGWRTVAETDASGAFRLDGVRSNGADIWCVKPPPLAGPLEYMQSLNDVAARYSRTIHVCGSEGEHVDLGQVQLWETLEITGTVLDAAGAPVHGGLAYVEGRGNQGGIQADGTFRIAGLEPGKHNLLIRMFGYDMRVLSTLRVEGVAAGASGVIVQLPQ